MEWQSESKIKKENNSPGSFPSLAMFIGCDFEYKIKIETIPKNHHL